MQIIIDTAVDSMEHITRVFVSLGRMVTLPTHGGAEHTKPDPLPAVAVSPHVPAAPVIKPEDNPAAGAQHGGTISDLTRELQARIPGAPPVPSLDLTPDPAAVFGGAAAPVPPVPPAPPVPAPAAPASSPASVTAPPAPAAGPSAGVELDKNGLPWDVRIHSSSREKNKTGEWRAKRGLNDAALVRKIEAELRAVQALPPAAVTAPVAPPVPPTPSPADQAAASAAFGSGGAAPPVPGAEAPPVPPAPPAPGSAPVDFPALMVVLTPAMGQGRLTLAMINEACIAHGVPSMPLLATRPDLVPAVYETIKAKVAL